MSKGWSSFKQQKLLQENWRDFLSEESGVAKRLRDRGYPVPVDHWEKWEKGEDDTPPPEQLARGLDSADNKDSLLRVLRQGAPFLRTPQVEALINVIFHVADDEGIMLELSLKGSNSELERIIDSAGTSEVLSTIAGFGLQPTQHRKLIKALNFWARANSIKFTPPPVEPSPVTGDIDDIPPAPDEESTQDVELRFADEPEEPNPQPPPEAETPQNPDPPMETIPVTREPPKSKEPVIKQVRGPGPAEPDPEPEEPERQGWSYYRKEYVPATPENARKELVHYFSKPAENHRKRAKKLKHIEELIKLGAGLRFVDTETDAVTHTGEWVQSAEDPDNMYLPSYRAILVMPPNLKSLWRRAKDMFQGAGMGIADTFVAEFESDIDPMAIENLEDVAKKMRSRMQSMRKPADAEALQETYDRWQTIAGINQRVL